MKTILKILLAGALLCAAVFAVSAQNSGTGSQSYARSLFSQAVRDYDAGEFSKAREGLEEIVRMGIHDPAVYYNLGNTCARTGDTGGGVFYYMQARRLAPRDGDIRDNLLRISPADNHPERFPLIIPFVWLRDYFSLDEWTLSAGVLFGTAFAVFAAALFLRDALKARRLRIVGILIAVLAVSALFFTALRFHGEAMTRTAVIMKAESISRSGPGEQFEEIYKLPAGTAVRLISTPQQGWVRMRLADGRSGYIRLGDVRLLQSL
ncbi:MAG TPA: SH3 domain-containing protein [Candidatus Sumerlaeota bacterium]|nr:SH3 domain-containing protein [Candidatus Sumerlaeota bacterium]